MIGKFVIFKIENQPYQYLGGIIIDKYIGYKIINSKGDCLSLHYYLVKEELKDGSSKFYHVLPTEILEIL